MEGKQVVTKGRDPYMIVDNYYACLLFPEPSIIIVYGEFC